MQNWIDRFLAESWGKWAATTESLYRHYLGRLAAWCTEKGIVDPGNVSTETLRAWLSDQPRWGISSRYQAIAACRNFFAWAVGQANSPAAHLRFPRRERRPQQSLNAQQLAAFLSICDTSRAKGIRDAAMISLMADSGLRVSETAGLQLEELDIPERSLQTRIKGGRVGQGVFGVYTAGLLAEWLIARARVALGGVTTVFVGVGGLTPGRPMTRDGIRANFYRLGVEAGIGPVMPHALRRTFATLSLRRGAPSRILQVAGRWSSLAMVEVYSQALTAKDFDGYFPVDGIMGVAPDS